MINAGVHVVGFMFSRDVNSYETRADWQKFDRGYVEHGGHGKRNYRILVAALGIIKARALIRNVHVAYARNLDLLVLALVGVWLQEAGDLTKFVGTTKRKAIAEKRLKLLTRSVADFVASTEDVAQVVRASIAARRSGALVFQKRV